MEYPIVFNREIPSSKEGPSPVVSPTPTEPQFWITRGASKAGQECKKWRLAEMNGWPETKTEIEVKCVDLGWPIGKVCSNWPVVYHRSCSKFVYIEVCFPSGVQADVEECVKGAALAGAVAAVISSPAGAGPAFEVALKGCLAAKGATWADEITVSAGTDGECGDWHPL